MLRLHDSNKISVAKVRDRETSTLLNLYQICLNEGYVELKIRNICGLWVPNEFRNSEACSTFQKNISLKGFVKEGNRISNNFCGGGMDGVVEG